ncbi:MAG TPA: 4-hydroxy-3-methylbut-2-enyl diphosphate reductase, partial [Rhizobiales bacterium]|nr:4-hydroxy-3-methylbut-2-enyl diphosphate reductase [Hyphomicrobiales bacterium]
DATCPLVSKVHMEASRHHKDGHQILLIGHEGHPEVVGTMGQLSKGAVTLIETVEDVYNFEPDGSRGLAFITQTTLSVDDTKDIIAALHNRFPDINAPHKEDICYATTNRQTSVKEIAKHCDLLLVVGAPNSSNSRRLVEVARKTGCENSALVQRASEIDWDKIKSPDTVGITAGASAPEVLVSEVIGAFQDRFEVTIDYVETAKESVTFKLPRQLRLDMNEKAAAS